MDSILFHPKLVHLPVALAVLMPLVSGVLLLAWWRGWLPARTWAFAVLLQAVLVLSGVLALRTGDAEAERVEGAVPERLVEAHEEAAEVFVWTASGVLAVLLLGLAVSRRSPGLPVATVGVVGTLVVLAAGYRTGQAGGALVYGPGGLAASVAPEGAQALPARVLRGDDAD